MYIFAGYDNAAMTCNDLYSFDIETNTWEKIKAQGTIPPSRFMHSAVVQYNAMYVFGGQGDNALLNDVHQFDFGTSTWSKPKTKGKTPTPRYGHTTVATDFGIYLIGGCGKAKDKPFSDVSLLDNNKEWFSVNIEDGEVPNCTNHASVWDPSASSLFTVGGKASASALTSVFVLAALKTFVEILPSHILINIFAYLSLADFGRVRRVCKKIRVACDDDLLWKRVCRQLLPYFREEDVKNTFKEHLVRSYTSADMIVSVPVWL